MAETIEIVRMRLVRVIEAGREEHAKLSERYAVLVAERDSLINQRDQEVPAVCPDCGAQLGQVRRVVTGVCPMHGVQHG